jgi:hypothetical protein
MEPKVHYSVHKTLPWDIILSQLNPVHTLAHFFFKVVLILSPHLHVGLPSGLCPWGFLIKVLFAFIIVTMHATFFTYLIILGLITGNII